MEASSMAEELPYDKTSPDSILNHARKLTYRSLSDVVELPPSADKNNRGDLGALVERYFFRYEPNSKHEPDFPEAGVELKTTGVIPSREGRYKAKERLVLTMINFNHIVEETWLTSNLLHKCRLMLILFYLYQKDVPVYRRIFVLEPLLFSFPNMDLIQIQRDWEFIQRKVKSGKAHELSEGDTFFLGACRKGAGGPNEKLVSQPFSEIGAKSRAFSLKQSYLDQIIGNHASGASILGNAGSMDIESATKRRFEPFIGNSVEELAIKLRLPVSNTFGKRHHRTIAEQILLAGESSVLELGKASIELKTIRLNQRGAPRESMSFPGFSFLEILNQEWEDSKFFERIERKFLFVVFAPDQGGVERLSKVGYWNMPYADRLEAEHVWNETKRRLRDGVLPLPKESESEVAHVRPKAANAADKAPTPSGVMLTKQAFWLNRQYIAKVVANL